ncbi:MAG TPA: hypothetical protein VFV34_00345 [Blastocatellia bacterium]|nr:hypothetical protein [Blastocatellia bacterium]
MARQPGRFGFARRYLDPASRLGEILFGVIMVLTVSLTAGLTADSGKEGARQLLWAVLGCNIAWGVIDGLMYAMGCITVRSGQARLILAIQETTNQYRALDIIRGEVEPKFEFLTHPEQREALCRSILAYASTRRVRRVSVTKDDFFGALACFWLVILACLPAAVPFLFLSDPVTALRISNALMVAMLFILGVKWGQYAYTNRWVAGMVMVGLGLSLVGVAILLGG